MLITSSLALSIKETIQPARRICLIMHAKPDHDTVGSALALTASLYLKEKAIFLFCPSRLPAQLLTLPKTEKINSDIDSVLSFNPDLIITLDASDAQVSGLNDLLPKFDCPPAIINIDHHKTNTLYGNLNVVDPQAASATQIIFSLFKEWGEIISKEIADYLLLGLITDTSCFSNPATSAQSLNIASQLMSLGANPNRLQNYLSMNYSAVFLQKLGKIFQEIAISEPWKIVFTVLKEAELQKNGLSLEEANGLTNFFNFLREGNVALLIKETSDGHLQCSLRALRENVDVSHLAKMLGGGGHAKAAGFTIKGKIVKMEEGWKVE